jgi:FMN phosphatase YigB (HAD superfamily)
LAAFPRAQNVWMIGDDLKTDVWGAEAAGIPAVLARTWHPAAKCTVSALSELPALVSRDTL